MRVLWITNILFPEAEALITRRSDFKSSGGWLLGASEALVRHDEVQLAVATVSTLVNDFISIDGERIKYYIIPFGKGNLRYNKDYEGFFKRIQRDFSPDIVHIHGTEYTQGLSYINACGVDNVVVSIQGLVSVCSRYYLAGLSKWEIIKNLTAYDLIKGSLLSNQRNYKLRGVYEKQLLSKVSYVIGRTDWDYVHVLSINPQARYHTCNETLRNEFYTGDIWDYDKCEKHTIFVSQASYPLKGFHQLIKAMPLIKANYPDARIRVAGKDITDSSGIKGKLSYRGYGKILKKLIRNLGLEDSIEFTGNLDAKQMKKEYLRTNVFVSPSSIENSPNSLGEAQILGVPCVSSYVGGAIDFMKGDEDNLYRFEEFEMLADKVCKIFRGSCPNQKMMDEAKKRHSPQTNSNSIIEIYNRMLS
jgi:glycosyltransferase involved in cell wall biosynthesis